ncbi:ABC transporter ATP-binding protein, partial [Clostridium botulinum]
MKISVENLNMIYKAGKKALNDVSLQIESPSFIGLLGPNGAGKSTLMKLLVAELIPTSGEILIDGVPLLKNERKLKASLGYLPQSFGLYDELTVWQFLDYMAALKGIKNSKKVIEEAIEKTNLTEKRKARIFTLSGGQRQRVGIAQALMGNPELLIFDEP